MCLLPFLGREQSSLLPQPVVRYNSCWSQETMLIRISALVCWIYLVVVYCSIGKESYDIVEVWYIFHERNSLGFFIPTYMVDPVYQNTIPNIIDRTNVFRNRTTLCSRFFQYAHLCFHRQAMHCALKFSQYLGGKCRSSVFGAGFPSSSIRSLFSLKGKY